MDSRWNLCVQKFGEVKQKHIEQLSEKYLSMMFCEIRIRQRKELETCRQLKVDNYWRGPPDKDAKDLKYTVMSLQMRAANLVDNADSTHELISRRWPEK